MVRQHGVFVVFTFAAMAVASSAGATYITPTITPSPTLTPSPSCTPLRTFYPSLSVPEPQMTVAPYHSAVITITESSGCDDPCGGCIPYPATELIYDGWMLRSSEEVSSGVDLGEMHYGDQRTYRFLPLQYGTSTVSFRGILPGATPVRVEITALTPTPGGGSPTPTRTLTPTASPSPTAPTPTPTPTEVPFPSPTHVPTPCGITPDVMWSGPTTLDVVVGEEFVVPYEYEPINPMYSECWKGTLPFPVYDGTLLERVGGYDGTFDFRAKAPGVAFLRMGPRAHDISASDITVNITGPTPTPITPTPTVAPTATAVPPSDSFIIQ